MDHRWSSHPVWSKAYVGWYQCKECKKEYHCRIIPAVFPKEECLIKKKEVGDGEELSNCV